VVGRRALPGRPGGAQRRRGGPCSGIRPPAIAAMMAVVLVLPVIAQALPDSWRNPVTEFWPTQAGSQLASVYHSAHTLQPWPGFGVMCLFVAIVYAIAWTLLDRRGRMMAVRARRRVEGQILARAASSLLIAANPGQGLAGIRTTAARWCGR